MLEKCFLDMVNAALHSKMCTVPTLVKVYSLIFSNSTSSRFFSLLKAYCITLSINGCIYPTERILSWRRAETTFWKR